MSMKELMAAGNSLASGDTPEGVSFDGTNDYLSRSSDLSFNADSTTTTISFLFYVPFGDYQMRVYDTSTTYVTVDPGSDSSGCTVSLYFDSGTSGSPSDLWAIRSTNRGLLPLYQWNHVLLSFNRVTDTFHFYLNDTLVSTSDYAHEFATTTATNFTNTTHYVCSNNGTSVMGRGRLAHLFLDYTYRDLSVTANRRLFIDSDGKPSSTIPSSPILYLPMTDAATAGSNSGTGGDFTVNGVLDTAGRGANQYNCSASALTSLDYLSKSISTNYNTKTVTLSCVVSDDGTNFNAFSIDNNNKYTKLSTRTAMFRAEATDGALCALIYLANANAFVAGKKYHITISFDLTNTNKRHLFINGVLQNNTYQWDTYVDKTINLQGSFDINNLFDSGRTTGSMGELYFDTNYIDLSTDNPFWDADANRPKPVRQVISETGTTPLIALPLRGDDAGNNLGTGGDFTVNSGPYTGARGGSEFWARSAEFNGSNQYLDRAALTGASDGRVFSLAFSALKDTTSNMDVFGFHPSGGYGVDRMNVVLNTGNVRVIIYDSGGTIRYDFSSTFTHGAGVWNTYLISGNVDTSGAAKISVNGNSLTLSENTRTPTDLNFSAFPNIGRTAYNYFNGKIGFLWFNTEYIDFSQESNRNLFVDQLGYPKDLTPAIDAGDIAEPLIYMKFDDTSDLGANSGTGGDFTVNGTVTAGADVDPNA